MNELSIKDLEEKIKKVQEDISGLHSSNSAGRKLEVLSEYKSYLEDELEFLKREARSAE